MAISQTKYIKFNASLATAAASRSFQALVFTTTQPNPGITNTYNLSLSEVAAAFGTSSAEYSLAEKYFAFRTPAGSYPASISFYVYTAGTDAEKNAFAAAKQTQGLSFGAFCFMPTEDDGDLVYLDKDVAVAIQTANEASDAKYGFVCGVTAADVASAGDYYNDRELFTNGAHTINWLCSASDNQMYMPLAISASANFNVSGGSVSYVYKSFAGAAALVTSDADCTAYKALNVNFYGKTQEYGVARSFTNVGKTGSGADIGVIMNELWLESEISGALLDLQMSVNKIPASSVGAAMIVNAIVSVAGRAIDNGVFITGATLDDAARNQVSIFASDPGAPDAIVENGYYLRADIKKGSGEHINDKICQYRLAYAKGDAILFIEGNHLLA